MSSISKQVADNQAYSDPISVKDFVAATNPFAKTASRSEGKGAASLSEFKGVPSLSKGKGVASRSKGKGANNEPILKDIFDMVHETFSPWNIPSLFNFNETPSWNALNTAPSRNAKSLHPTKKLSNNDDDRLAEMTSVECTLMEEGLDFAHGIDSSRAVSGGANARGTKLHSKFESPSKHWSKRDPNMQQSEGRSPNDVTKFAYV